MGTTMRRILALTIMLLGLGGMAIADEELTDMIAEEVERCVRLPSIVPIDDPSIATGTVFFRPDGRPADDVQAIPLVLSEEQVTLLTSLNDAFRNCYALTPAPARYEEWKQVWIVMRADGRVHVTLGSEMLGLRDFLFWLDRTSAQRMGELVCGSTKSDGLHSMLFTNCYDGEYAEIEVRFDPSFNYQVVERIYATSAMPVEKVGTALLDRYGTFESEPNPDDWGAPKYFFNDFQVAIYGLENGSHLTFYSPWSTYPDKVRAAAAEKKRLDKIKTREPTF